MKVQTSGKKTITPIDVVKLFLKLQDFDTDCGDVITNLKAQKLIYYAQGIYMAKTGEPLFEDDFEAWQHGPVIPGLYRELKEFKNCQIQLEHNDESIDKFSDGQLNILISVYKTYGRYSAWALRDMTHGESPWKDTLINEVISKAKIKSYFETVLATQG